jgi:Major Facilitator Superfamily
MNIALPSAQRALHFTTADRQWVVTAYSLAFGSLLLAGGKLGDLIGRRTTFLVGLVGFAGVSAVGGASTNFATLVAACACQGVFAAILVPSALALLITSFTEPKDRARAFGIFGAIATAGGAIGLLLGGALTDYLPGGGRSTSTSPSPPSRSKAGSSCSIARRRRRSSSSTSPACCWPPAGCSVSSSASLTPQRIAGTPGLPGDSSPPEEPCLKRKLFPKQVMHW